MRSFLLFFLLLFPALAQPSGRYNVIGRDTMSPGGHGLITINEGWELVAALELDITEGPLQITRVLVHFSDRRLKPFPYPIAARTSKLWTSKPIRWPGGKERKVTAVEYWYTGKTGAKPQIAVLGLQY